jgi:signal peptidase I
VYADAWNAHLAGPARGAPRSGWGHLSREIAVTAVFAVLLFFATHTVVQGREVHGPSMQPTYHEGQRLFITRYLFHGPHRGDVVVFDPPVHSADQYIKRIVGMPGDQISVRGGRVRVNGELLDEPYLHGMKTACAGRWCEVTLGADQYFVMGDNRTNSSDSRYWGPVTRDSLAGKAWLLYYPFSEAGLAP